MLGGLVMGEMKRSQSINEALVDPALSGFAKDTLFKALGRETAEAIRDLELVLGYLRARRGKSDE